MVNIGVLASGGGTNLQAIIDAIEAGRLDARIKVVISDKPDAYALIRAKKHGIDSAVITKELHPSREDFDRETVKVLKGRGVELVCLAGYMRLLSSVVLNAFPLRVMNIHPSLLPSFPGLNVQKKALDYGAKFSGCTVHFVDLGLDTGPIIIQAVVPVLAGDTPETLAKRILAEEHRIYPQAIELFAEGKLEVKDRMVVVKGHPEAEGSLANPRVTIP